MSARLLLLAGLVAIASPAAAEQRIVSIGAPVTEIVYALGAQDSLVAVDSTSLYPPAADALPDVGYMRQLAAEPIIALAPSLVLAEEDSGPPDVLDQMRAAGINLVIVPDTPTVAGVAEKIELVAGALDRPVEGRALAVAVEADIAKVAKATSKVGERPRVLFLLSVGGTTLLGGGRDTAVAGLIALAGGENALDDFEGFKPVSPEALAAIDADVVLVSTRTAAQMGGADAIFALPGVSMTKAARDKRLAVLDGLLLLGFGPRTAEGARQLAAQIHPDLALPAAE